MTEARPAIDDDLFSPEACRDPQRHDARIRDRAPVVYLPRYGVWATGRHDTIWRMLRDWRTFSSTRPPFREAGRDGALLAQDPPEHGRLRAAVEGALSPAVLRALQQTFRDAAERLVDKVVSPGSVIDGHEDLAEAYVLEVFPDALGLGPEGRHNLVRYGHARFNALGPGDDRAAPSGPEADVYAWVDASTRREALAPDGIAASLFAAADRGEVSDGEARLLLRALYAAGSDTTILAIGKTLKAMADFPEQWQLLRDDPDKVRSAFEEGLRYDNPARFTCRRATVEVDVEGVRLPADARILLLHMPAGRDPRRWEAPDRYDIRRDVIGQHLGLGFGLHACVGAPLARIQVTSLLAALARSVRAIELAGEPRPTDNVAVHGYEHLPLRLEAA